MKKTLLVVILLTQIAFSQEDDLKLGKTMQQTTASVFDLSDPKGVNIEVSLWGFVKFPGRYIIPYNSTLVDIISFSGGPTESSNLQDIRIFRQSKDSLNPKSSIIKLNYDDLLWDDEIKQGRLINPVLQSGDIILVRQENRYSFRENLSIILPIVTSVLSVATFIVTVSR